MGTQYVGFGYNDPKLYIAEIRRNREETARAAAHRAGLESLRAGLQKQYGVQINENGLSEEIAFGEHGKPYLKKHPEIYFNISHSHGYAICALADRPVGVDIEKIVPIRDALIHRTLTDEEQNVFARLIERGYCREEVFFRFWTLKESYFKWDGCGLTKELKEVRFTLRAAERDGAKDAGRMEGDAWIAICEDPSVICRTFSLQEAPGHLLAWCMTRDRAEK